MSGGSLSYFYLQLQEHIGDFGDKELDNLVSDLADLFYAREWYLSSDTCEDDWKEARDKFKKKWLTEQGYKERIEKYLSEFTSEIKETFGIDAHHCKTCKHNPPSKKWPCADCDMRDPADRWERQDAQEANAGDLISRQALCEYALNQKDKSVTPNDIMRFPPVQPEIIHCKDCKHHHKDNNGTYYCGRNGYGWKLNDFCSDAERRTD